MHKPAGFASALRAARILLFANAAIWLALGIAAAARGSKLGLESQAARWIIASLMAGNAALLLISGWGLGSGRRLFYLVALAVLGVNILLTFTDEFGMLDLLTLMIDLAILALLLASWKSFSPHAVT